MPFPGEQNPGWRWCQAKRTNGEPCRRPALKGLNVCKAHGGGNPVAQAKGLERYHAAKIEEKARRIVERQGITALEDPIQALEDTIAEKIALKDFLKSRVDELTSIRYESKGGAEQVRGELSFYVRMLDDVTKSLVDYTRLGLEERKVRVTELQRQQVAEAWLRLSNDFLAEVEKAGQASPEVLAALGKLKAQLPEMARKHLMQGAA